jgi:mRNA-degrading endonuclease RelE of RelBE toxin-antitoxin system
MYGIPVHWTCVRTVIETPTFQRQAERIWSEGERFEFIEWIAGHPEAGDVIPGAGGARKVRWSRAGHGKRGGVRVIYFNVAEDGTVVLVMLYAKADRSNVPPGAIDKAV